MYNSLLKIFFVLALCVFFPFIAYASELRLDSSKVDLRVEEEFTVEIIMNVDEQVNAIDGQIVFPDTLLEMQEIRDGNSSINFWIEKPRIESAGTLIFSGITPGGFSGVNNQIFSIIFKAKQEGTATISIAQANALQNDGVGTNITLALRNVVVNVKAGDSGVRKHVIEDVVSPEPFTPIITHDPSLFEGKSFVVFSTQDKGSGVNRYEVREGKWGWFRIAESPHLLKSQKLDWDIYVKAIDNAGNERVAVLKSSVHRNWWEGSGLFVILIMVVFVAVAMYKKIWARFTR